MKITEKNGVMTVELTGEIDHHTARPIREKTDEKIAALAPKQLVLDFSEVSFMDSSAVGLVMGRYKLTHTLGGDLSVKGLKARDKRMMELSGLKKIVEFE